MFNFILLLFWIISSFLLHLFSYFHGHLPPFYFFNSFSCLCHLVNLCSFILFHFIPISIHTTRIIHPTCFLTPFTSVLGTSVTTYQRRLWLARPQHRSPYPFPISELPSFFYFGFLPYFESKGFHTSIGNGLHGVTSHKTRPWEPQVCQSHH